MASTTCLFLSLLFVCALASPGPGDKQVFAHFMVGNSYGYDQGHFASDMSAAKSVGIDAFALNIGTDSWTSNRVSLAYAAANQVGFKVFLSFDMSLQNNAQSIISMIQSTGKLPGQYIYNNQVFVSTFGGASVTMGYSSAEAAWSAIKSTLSGQGLSIFFVANFEVDANTIFQNYPSIDGALSWGAWPNPTADASSLTPGDNVYMQRANSAKKVYLAPISPWFFTHLSYKNYIYHCESLWYDRWQQLFSINPHMIEIITWNDWGESHYIGTIDSNSGDLPAGSQAYVYGFPHTAWQATLPYFISKYKTGNGQISRDIVVYWYRPFLKGAVASNDPLGQPYVANQDTSRSSYTPSQVLQDNVYILSILTSPGTLVVANGGTNVTQNVPAGANLFAAKLNTGTQAVTLYRNNGVVCSSKGDVSVENNPSAYNYNVFVGQC
jgi:glucan endo-1,3-alpha-glucosidase